MNSGIRHGEVAVTNFVSQRLRLVQPPGGFRSRGDSRRLGGSQCVPEHGIGEDKPAAAKDAKKLEQKDG